MDELLQKFVNAPEGSRSAALGALSKEQLEQLMTSVSKAAQKKKSKGFESLTERDLQERLNLNLTNVSNDKIEKPSVFLPSLDVFPSRAPSKELKFILGRLRRVWTRASEAGCRTFIDAIISEALDVVNGWEGDAGDGQATKDNSLRAYPEATLKHQGASGTVKGRADYLIGHVNASKLTYLHMDAFMIGVEAKVAWTEWAWIQAVGEGGALLRKRLSHDRQGPIFVVLTNAKNWQFFVIDEEGWVYSSGKPIRIDFGNDEDLELVLRWLRWFATAAADISPRSSLSDINAKLRGKMAEQIRTCLSRDGLAPPPSSLDSALTTLSSWSSDDDMMGDHDEDSDGSGWEYSSTR
ncbi:hypothetical protein HK104_000316 [Borealophlyctis nickersoniae]|nr:hypothetical protein HK104_000316 [Borealophlyctis nickersoniae]